VGGQFVFTGCNIVYVACDHSSALRAAGFKVVVAGKLPAQLMMLNDRTVYVQIGIPVGFAETVTETIITSE